MVDDDGFQYESVPELEMELPEMPDNDDDLNAIVSAMMKGSSGNGGYGSPTFASSAAAAAGGSVLEARTESYPSVADDFIRNFLIRAGLSRSLDAFNTEWFELKQKGGLPGEDAMAVPDVYAQNQRLEELATRLRLELGHAQEVAAKAQSTWDRFRKERDFHRMHHKRVVQEKNKLIVDIRRLKHHYEQYEPTLVELRTKYELAMKEKMLLRLERDRLAARIAALESQLKAYESGVGAGDMRGRSMSPTGIGSGTAKPRGGVLAPTAASVARAEAIAYSKPVAGRGGTTMPAPGGTAAAAAAAAAAATRAAATAKDSKLPAEDLVNPYLSLVFEPARASSYKQSGVIKAHGAPISALAFHPTKPVVVTGSDDMTWRMWAVQSANEAELIFEGEGHRAWLADADFHPGGTLMATSSGDGIVKLWSLTSAACVATFADHTQTAWGLSFHSGGDFLASCSMDHTVKLWDTATGKVRQTFRGHVDSVNAVNFQPFSANLATASGDKTVSVWDARSGLCIQIFYGHENAVNDVVWNMRGDTLASCDADGHVILWDVRMVARRAALSLGRQPVHSLAFDRSAQVLAAACEDGVVRILDTSGSASTGGIAVAASLRGHDDSVQAVSFDPTGQYLVSTGNDATVRIWSEGQIRGAGLTLPPTASAAASASAGPSAGTGAGGGMGLPDGDD